MPIYAYRCATCGHAKDVLQKMSDPVLSVCPQCGAPTFEKQVTAAGFQLKGSGWYVTDFRGDNKKPAGPAGDGAGADASKESSKESPKDGGSSADAAGGASEGGASKGDSNKGDSSKSDSSKSASNSDSSSSGSSGKGASTPAPSASPSAAPPASPASGGK
jgi:putative FmdB family regulatory protein